MDKRILELLAELMALVRRACEIVDELIDLYAESVTQETPS